MLMCKEGPLNGPQATRGGHDGRIDHPMGMRVSMGACSCISESSTGHRIVFQQHVRSLVRPVLRVGASPPGGALLRQWLWQACLGAIRVPNEDIHCRFAPAGSSPALFLLSPRV